MKKNKFLTVLALVGALSLGLTGCGSKNSYDDVVKLLQKGQYDAAITKIEEYKTKAETEGEKAEVDVEEEDAALLAKLVGEYELNPSYANYEGNNYFTSVIINDDMTINCDGNSYPFTIKRSTGTDSKGQSVEEVRIQFKINDLTKSFMINENSRGYISLDSTYIRPDLMQADADDVWSKLVGTYIDKHSFFGFETAELTSDYTIIIDGTSYPVKFTYSESSDAENEGVFNFYVMNSDNVYTSNISYSIAEDGTVEVYNLINQNQVEYVELTADNFWDYFEWSDYTVDSKNTNAFDEVTSISVAKFLKLKDEYTDKFLSEYSDLALEFTYDNMYAPNATIVWDSSSDSLTVDEGVIEQDSYTPTDTTTFSYLGSRYDYEQNRNAFYYLYTTSRSVYVEDSYVTVDGTTWTATNESFYGLGYTPDHCQITRSATTLAFKK